MIEALLLLVVAIMLIGARGVLALVGFAIVIVVWIGAFGFLLATLT